MKIIHDKKEGEGEGSFLLPDGRGGYLCLADKPDSHYDGWLEFDGCAMYKTLANIWLDTELDTIKVLDGKVYRRRGEAVEKFQVRGDKLCYEVSDYDGWMNFEFDFRNIHDFDDEGRRFDIYKKGDILVVKYTKAGENAHEKYLAMSGVGEYYNEDSWNFNNYDYDLRRNSKSVFYTYGPLKARVFMRSKIIIARADTEEEAVQKAKEDFEPQPKKEGFETPEGKALASLDGLRVEDGILAGFPWFFQDWARDELISLKPYIMRGDHEFAKRVLMKNLRRLDGGKLPNKGESSDLASADAAGWLFLRFHEFLQEGGEESFSEEELREVKTKFDHTVDAIRRDLMQDGLVQNEPLETWMDTRAANDVRAGARVEIQALFLRTLKFGDYLAKLLGDKDNYAYMEDNIRENVREKMYRDGVLADGYENGSPDWTQRPNVFIACYAAPDLLTVGEWNLAFDNALEKLWLDWGGLASIEKGNVLYKDEYTGQTNESYHRGDSWYYVNNMAAVCLRKLNAHKYRDTVEKIKEASVREMLYSGFLGHCAEVSSAKELRSEGARCQAWSAATLYELLTL